MRLLTGERVIFSGRDDTLHQQGVAIMMTERSAKIMMTEKFAKSFTE